MPDRFPFDITVNGIPRDLTASRWHAPIHAPNGRPVGAYTVTVTTPPDATIPCRLTLEPPPDLELPDGATLTLEQRSPARRVWWTGPAPEPLLLVTEHGDVIADEHGDALDWSTVTVIDLRSDGCHPHQTRDAPRPKTHADLIARRVARTSENARVAFRDLTGYTRVDRGPGYQARSSERLEHIARDYPSVTADAHTWLANPDSFTRLARDVITIGLAEPGRMGPRVNPDPDDARADWHRLTEAVRVHLPEPEPQPEPEPAPPKPPKPEPKQRAARLGRLRRNCEHCAAHGHTARAETVDPATVAGRLATPLRLCAWCRKWVVATGALPTAADVHAHHNGRRLPRPRGTEPTTRRLTVTRAQAAALLRADVEPGEDTVTLNVELPPDPELHRLLSEPPHAPETPPPAPDAPRITGWVTLPD